MRPAIVNVTTRRSRPEAPPTLALYPLWDFGLPGTLERWNLGTSKMSYSGTNRTSNILGQFLPVSKKVWRSGM